MERDVYFEAIRNSASAFAYHEAVFDENGQMVDYIFLDVNPAFEELTGLKKENILHKRFVRDRIGDEDYSSKWINIYNEVLKNQKLMEFEEYSGQHDRYYSVKAYPSGKNRFVTIFQNRTFEKRMQEISQQFISNAGEPVNYDITSEFAREVSGAEYAAFNLFRENGREFTTVSIVGMSQNIVKGLKMLGFPVIGKDWPYDPVREEKTKGREITFFDSVFDLTGKVLPAGVVSQLTKTMGLGQVVIAKIRKDEKVLGDFTLFFKKGQQLKNRDLLLLYMSQLGLFIEKYRLDMALKSSREMFYTLAEYAPVGFVSCNTKGEITYANKRLLEIMDSPSYHATKNINLLKYPMLLSAGFSEKLKECMEKDRPITHEMGYYSMWGKYSWLRIYFTPYREKGSVIGANIVLDDISDKKISEDELKEKANRDALTRAYNRNALETVLADRLVQAGEQGRISCLAVVDIDDFKQINDNYGHRAGDSVLQYLAARAKQELRELDLIIRTGGDEFLIYLHDIKAEANAEAVVERLFGKISTRYQLQGDSGGPPLSLDVSCSIGASFFPRDGRAVEMLMVKADEALYEAKRNGKAGYSFFRAENSAPQQA